MTDVIKLRVMFVVSQLFSMKERERKSLLSFFFLTVVHSFLLLLLLLVFNFLLPN